LEGINAAAIYIGAFGVLCKTSFGAIKTPAILALIERAARSPQNVNDK
jgi:hypothetical protein